MKICFFISSISGRGGSERVTALIANRLALEGFEVSILSLWDASRPAYQISRDVTTAQLFTSRISFVANFIPAVFRFRNYLRKNKIDVLVDSDSVLSVFTVPAVANTRVRHLVWEHFNFYSHPKMRVRRVSRWIASRFADTIITLTKKDALNWRKAGARGAIVPIYNPSPYPVQKECDWHGQVVLAVGRLTHQKGFDYLIDAWRFVQDRNPSWRLWIVGEGEEEAKLHQQIRRQRLDGTVSIFPFSSNPGDFFSQASIFCLSSRYEGLGMVLIEAQCFGLPCVAFNCDVGPAEIIEQGINGFLVKPFDIKEFAMRINQLIEDTGLREAQGRAALSLVGRFQMDAIVPQWKKLLDVTTQTREVRITE